jgi:cytoskeleton protein RodZ
MDEPCATVKAGASVASLVLARLAASLVEPGTTMPPQSDFDNADAVHSTASSEPIEIGATLRQARLRQGVDFAALEARSKIRERYLRALEDEQWSVLPGYPFAKAFLRVYADMLGLDDKMLVDEFKRQAQDPSELRLAEVLPAAYDASGTRSGDLFSSHAGGRRRRSSTALAALVLVVLVAAALFTIEQLTRGHSGASTALRTTAPRTRPRAVPHHTTVPTHSTTPSTVSLQLAPTGTVYVCLFGYPAASDSDPQILVNGILSPASGRPVYHADNHFLVTFANSRIQMLIDAHSHAVTTTPIAVVSYEILPGGSYHQIAPSAAPRCP